MNDPELAFFKTYKRFKDSDIQHTIDDAFNNNYGLNFSDSQEEQTFLSEFKDESSHLP